MGNITKAVVLKDGDVFFLTEPDGHVPLDGAHGFGLYYHDCRFLHGYELEVAGMRPDLLVSTAGRGYAALFQFTNADIQLDNGRLISKETIGVRWERVIDAKQCALHEQLALRNYGSEPISLPLTLVFSTAFEDVYEVRGLLPKQAEKLQTPVWKDGVLHFGYRGEDDLYRGVDIHCSGEPDHAGDGSLHLQIALEPGESKMIYLSIVMWESPDRDNSGASSSDQPDAEQIQRALRRPIADWLQEYTSVQSDSVQLNKLLERSFRDIRMLRTERHDRRYMSAGVPWFVTLFGRDSLITALQILPYQSDIAADTLHLLASYQGNEVDDWRDEQPGKILHELRVGEMARTGEIPHTPYYGTVDATILFLILICQHAAWTGDLKLFHDLRPNIDRALEWIAVHGDRDGDGYVEYHSASDQGLVNQGWKDSGDAIVNADGSLATPPIALVEVQGYVYLAKTMLADLYERAGEGEQAQRLRREAAELRERFNRDYWLDEQGYYALARQAGNRPVAVMSSNPGHVLWTGIADPDKARETMDRLRAPDMWSGWGIRTLSAKARGYNPIGYHLGTVWPHDNALIAAGFRRYGFDEAFRRVLHGIIDAAPFFEDQRLPEAFAGFDREEFGVPVRYPVACHPQAWAAGSVPYLLTTALGLQPEAFERRLRIVRPLLPDFVEHLEMRQLRVGDATVDLQFDRSSNASISVRVLRVEGDLAVVVEPTVADA